MTKMRSNFTLPELEANLEGLTEGALLPISAQDYQGLFGTNDAAAVRLRNFARGMLASLITRARRSCFAKSSYILTRELVSGVKR